MKIRSAILRRFIYACMLSAGTCSFGQVTQIWTGAGDGVNIDNPTNWSGSANPIPANNDTGEWNGNTTSNLFLINNGGAFASGPGQSGINIHLTSSQTNSVSIDTTLTTGQGFALWNTTLDSGAGGLTFGGTSSAHLFYMPQRPSGAIHTYLNNSSNLITFNPRIIFKAGGGSAYVMDFQGTGNFQVNNFLECDNGASMSVQVDGPGTTVWNPQGYFGGDPITAVTITGGTLVLEAPHSKLNTKPISNAGTFVFDAPSQAQTLAGVISGAGSNVVAAGTLTLQGASTYTGNTVLTGGEAIVNIAETNGVTGPLGVGGTISFQGGTLGFSINNTYDYSPRFDTSAGQTYSIDTASQDVTFTNALTSAGATLTKLGAGILTLSGANTYSGTTTVGAGALEIKGAMGSGNIVVDNSSILGVTETGPQITPANLTVGTSSSAILEFNNVSSQTSPAIAAGSISAAGGPIQVNVNSGSFHTSDSYPLFSWSSGSAPAVTLGNLTGAIGNLITNGNMIVLNITGLDYIWTGNANADWDTTTANNWQVSGVASVFANTGAALFDDTVPSANTNIIVNSPVSPVSTTVNSSAHPYSIASSGANSIGGSGTFTKSGTSFLTVSGGVNNYSGATAINGGTMSVGALANGGAASDIGASPNGAANLVLNGGSLQYSGASASIDRLFTVGTFGGTIDNEGTGQLTLNNNGSVGLSGTGARTLVLTGVDAAGDTLAAILGDNGGSTALTKTGVGTWILTGNNSYSGVTTIANGELQVGTGGANGTLGTGTVVDNGSLNVDVSGTVTIGTISGTGTVTNNGSGMLILPGNNSYAGGTFINAGTVQFGTGGATGAPYGNAPIAMTNNSTVIFDSTSLVVVNGFANNISGQGNLIVRAGFLNSGNNNNNTYTGWTEIDPGATFEACVGQTTGFVSSVVTNNGVLKLVSQNIPPTFGVSNNIVGTGILDIDIGNQNAGYVVIAGTNNSYTGGTLIGGGGLVIGDGLTTNAGNIIGSVVFTNTTGPTTATFSPSKRILFNRIDNFAFTNPCISMVSDGSTAANSGSMEQDGPGIVTITGNNSYPGETLVTNNSTMIVGNGATSGNVGTNGPVRVSGLIEFDRSDNVNYSVVVMDAMSNGAPGFIDGSVAQIGSGVLTLSGAVTNTGYAAVSNGTLVVSSTGGDMDVAGGTLAPGGLNSVGTLVVAGNLNLSAGTVAVTLNKSLAQSNSFVSLTNIFYATNGDITYTGGNVSLANVGPALNVGDRFVIFSKLVPGGDSISIVASGFTVNNHLGDDGSVTVATVSAVAQPATINKITLSGGNVILTATNNTGPGGTYHLLGTNNIKAPLSTWPVVSTGSFDSNGNVSITNGVGSGQMFYDLQQP